MSRGSAAVSTSVRRPQQSNAECPAARLTRRRLAGFVAAVAACAVVAELVPLGGAGQLTPVAARRSEAHVDLVDEEDLLL